MADMNELDYSSARFYLKNEKNWDFWVHHEESVFEIEKD